MNLGAFAVQAAMEFWSPENRARRKQHRTIAKAWRKARRDAKRRGEPMPEQVKVVFQDGQEVQRTEPIIPARTSTKVAVVGVPGSFGLLEVLQAIDWPGTAFDNFLHTQAAAMLITLAVSYVTARLVKSPTVAPTAL